MFWLLLELTGHMEMRLASMNKEMMAASMNGLNGCGWWTRAGVRMNLEISLHTTIHILYA